MSRATDVAERFWMEQALALAALGEGTTSPNPRVGCVLVRNGRDVGSGFHREAGRFHAEAEAIRTAGPRARGATAFVNLEPCAHHGRTPPCADLLIDSGIERVVASIRDPNPRVDGRGFRKLAAAGIQVEVGLLADEARLLNEPFLHWHATGRPLVTLKAAISLDGMIAAAGGASRWISGEPARRFAHRLRLRHDAVLVGAGTVRRDDPRLTARVGRETKVRRRVVLAPSLDLRAESHVFERRDAQDPPTRVYTTHDAPASAAERLAGRAEVVRVDTRGERLDLAAVLRDLGSLGVQSLLVEGGGRTLASFLDAGVADRAAVFVAPRLLGARGGTPMLDGPAVAEPGRGFVLERRQVLALGEDLLVLGRISRPRA